MSSSKHEWQATYVRLPIALHDALKRRAAAEDRTMAQLVRQIVRLYLEVDE